jgi:hypothetical protein
VAVLAVCVIFYCAGSAYFLKNLLQDNYESLIMLVIFNFLFAYIIFQLGGSAELKLGVLALGNLTGLVWNYLFLSIFNSLKSSIESTALGSAFGQVSYVVLFPFWNVLWFVSFWSLSLTFIPKINSCKVTVQA